MTKSTASLSKHELEPGQLRWECQLLFFAEDRGRMEPPGQKEALEALQTGLSIRQQGYNVYVGAGQPWGQELALEQARQRASDEPTPGDWCYVANFDDPQRPRALALPPGWGRSLAKDMDRLVENLLAAIPTAFESEGYRAQQVQLRDKAQQQEADVTADLDQQAQKLGIRLVETAKGLMFTPTNEDGTPLQSSEFSKLSDEEIKDFEERVEQLRTQFVQNAPELEKAAAALKEQRRQLDNDVAEGTARRLIAEFAGKYATIPDVMRYLARVQKDVAKNLDLFRRPKEIAAELHVPAEPVGSSPLYRRYKVNVVVEREPGSGAPVVYEDHPSYDNVGGKVEYQAQMGTLVTDFTMIRGGALHQANGGYLVLDAQKVLTKPYAWECLKRALRTGEATIESLGESLSLIATATLRPEPIPLDTKVVLVGSYHIYDLLCQYDSEFKELFSILAWFRPRVDRDANLGNYAQAVQQMTECLHLRPLSSVALARVIEHAAELAHDARRLINPARLEKLLIEANHYTEQTGHTLIQGEDVLQALDAARRRKYFWPEIVHGSILRDETVVETTGERVGQGNGLSVLTEADGEMFGAPCRITATAGRASQASGDKSIIDIDVEAEMADDTHEKGMLTLEGFLLSRFGRSTPLNLQARIVMEQEYEHHGGPSASGLMTCVMLSAIGGVPLKQSYAMTGTISQRGEIGTIGGVNQKVEGFYDICNARELTGEQGVIIPRSNVQHLMLRQDVVQAVRDGKFHIHAVGHVDEALDVLTGGIADVVNDRVEWQLAEWAKNEGAGE